MSEQATEQRPMSNLLTDWMRAAHHADWMTVVLNGGPPCFRLEEGGRFCLRAERWAGHGAGDWPMHEYLSLAELLANVLALAAPQRALRFKQVRAAVDEAFRIAAEESKYHGKVSRGVVAQEVWRALAASEDQR